MLRHLHLGSPQLFYLNILHIFNDGFHASLLLFLPFIAKDLNINLTQAGFLGTLVNSLSILLALPAGFIATKIGGFKTLIIAFFLYGLGFIGAGNSFTYYALVPMFMLAGAGFGLFHPVGFALIAKLSDKENRGKLMGNFTAIGDVGRIGISALLTFIIVFVGWHSTAMLFGIIAIITAIIFIYLLKNRNEHFATKDKKISEVKIIEILRNKRFIYSTLAAFCDSIASSSLFIFLPFLLLKRGADPILLGSFSAAFFIGNLAGKAVLGRFVDKYGSTRVFIVSELLMALFILILANSTILPVIVFTSIILGIFTKGTIPVGLAMVTEAVEHHGNYEKAFGVNGFIVSIALTIAPVILGFISDRFGIVFAFTIMACVALTAIVPALLFHFTKHQELYKKN